MVHPTDRIVMVYVLGSDGKYPKPKVHGPDDKLSSSIFPALTLEMEALFKRIEL